MALRDFKRHSRAVTKTKRWRLLRLEILDRDEWRCVKCGDHRRLEVDHIEPVRARPDLSYARHNLQTLCRVCHSKKTAIEVGFSKPNPRREAWKSLVRDLHQCPSDGKDQHHVELHKNHASPVGNPAISGGAGR